jgi:hypothetical protein
VALQSEVRKFFSVAPWQPIFRLTGPSEEAGCVCAGIKRLSALESDNANDQKAPSLFRKCIFWHGIQYCTIVVASLFAMHEKSVPVLWSSFELADARSQDFRSFILLQLALSQNDFIGIIPKKSRLSHRCSPVVRHVLLFYCTVCISSCIMQHGNLLNQPRHCKIRHNAAFWLLQLGIPSKTVSRGKFY